MPPRSITTCFAAWGLFQYVPMPKEWLKAFGLMLNVWGAYKNIYEELLPRNEDESVVGHRLLGAVGISLVMGVAYRNVIHTLDWLVSDMPKRPTSSKSASRSKRDVDTSGRASVRVSLRRADDGAGPIVAPMSKLQGVLLDEAPSNVHGKSIFPIKVSLPLASSKIDKSAEGAGRALGMVYDAERSFQAFLDLEADDVPNMAVLTRLVATEGEAGGVTAYMDARREGDDLLIFVDKVIAPPKQKW